MRFILVTLLIAPCLPAQPQYDLLLTGGHVIDAKNRIDGVRDVAVADGRIAHVATHIEASQARKIVDCSGLYVTPGLLDIHVHVYHRLGRPAPGRNYALDPDSFSFRSGVTTMVDAGTSGWKEFPTFREQVISRAKTRVLAFLDIVASGNFDPAKESDPKENDADAAARCARENADVIVGFKSAHYAGPGWYSIDNAVKAGNMTKLPVMVDFGLITQDRGIDMLFLEKLRPGDIYTHCFSGHREELLENGKLNPVMWAGRKRGIFFDIGHGSGGFFWYVAVPAYQEGFYPDSISTDLQSGSMNGGAKDMTNVMSSIRNLGFSLADVIRMSTWNPAQEIRRPQLGNLDIGAEADVAVLRLERGTFGLLDSAGARKSGTERILCELTLRKGQVVWDRNGLTSQNWQSFPYKRGPFFKRTPPALTGR